MIERTLLNAAGKPLLFAHRMDAEAALFVREEGLPELLPAGATEAVAATGIKIFSGGDALVAGSYTLTFGTAARDPATLFELQRTVVRAAVLTRAVQRGNEVLRIARFERIKRTITGGAQLYGGVEVSFTPAAPYWFGPLRTLNLVGSGAAAVINLTGDGPAYPRVSVTASVAVTTLQIVTPAGITSLVGGLPAGQTLVVDSRPGQWQAVIGDIDVSARLRGPQPHLLPGVNLVGVTAAGTLVSMSWQEARL